MPGNCSRHNYRGNSLDSGTLHYNIKGSSGTRAAGPINVHATSDLYALGNIYTLSLADAQNRATSDSYSWIVIVRVFVAVAVMSAGALSMRQ